MPVIVLAAGSTLNRPIPGCGRQPAVRNGAPEWTSLLPARIPS
jgi:hypothetical protein